MYTIWKSTVSTTYFFCNIIVFLVFQCSCRFSVSLQLTTTPARIMIPIRLVIWMMMFTGITFGMLGVGNITMGIIAMVQHPNTTEGIVQKVSCVEDSQINRDNKSLTNQVPGNNIFPWNKSEQNLVLGAFYATPWLSQFLGGVLCHRYGAKHVMGQSVLISCALSYLIPQFAYFGPMYVAAVRVAQGFISSLGGAVAIVALIGKWSPPKERGFFMSVNLAFNLGSALMLLVYGYMSEYYGWESVFYAPPVFGTIWFICWSVTVYDSPLEHPWISEAEKEYIIKEMGEENIHRKLPIPWKQILTSGPFWVAVVCQFGTMWCVHTMIMFGPIYFEEMFGFRSDLNGIVTGVPYIARSASSLFGGIISDLLVTKNMMSVTHVRKWCTFIGCILAGISLFGVIYWECDPTIAIVSVTTYTVLSSLVFIGPAVAIVDISPNFCDILQGICGSAGFISGLLSALCVEYFSEEEDPKNQWYQTFVLCIALQVITGIIFIVFGTSEVQPWNFKKQEKANDSEEGEELEKLSTIKE